jgi:hypothetical protein
MVRTCLTLLIVAFGNAGNPCTHAAFDLPPQESANDAHAIRGLWSGSWGGGERNGAVFQPQLAEMLVEGDSVELRGFRNANQLIGRVRVDAVTNTIRITPEAADDNRPASRTLVYKYELNDDVLRLVDSDDIEIRLQKELVTTEPLPNVEIELASADSLDAAGDLQITKFTLLRSGRTGAVSFQPRQLSLSTDKATILQLRENGLKEISVDEARKRIHGPTPVVLAYRRQDLQTPHQAHQLWKDIGAAAPDSPAVWRTFSKVLRPGTLVFILSFPASTPAP